MSGRLVLLRHGQSLANVERRLDTRPPGAALSDLGHQQARAFGQRWPNPVGLVAHSVARRAIETAADVGAELGLPTRTLEGIHEVQVGELENRNDEEAIERFGGIYRRWLEGDLDAPMPAGESGTDVLARYLPVVTQLRMRYLDDEAWTGDVVVVSHGAAIRLVGAALSGVGGGFALEHHLGNTDAVVLSPVTDGRWSCVQWAALVPPFDPEPEVGPSQDAPLDADPMG